MAHGDIRALILIGDGLGDRPVPQLDGRTPLEAQPTPNLDTLAKMGECGLMDPIGVGVPAGSDTAHFAMLGYDPYVYYTGRGPLEALGVGMDVQRGDLGFRCNFATVEVVGDQFVVKDRRAGRITEGTDRLAQALNEGAAEIEGIQFQFQESVAHRGALILRDPEFAESFPADYRYDPARPLLTDSDPHHEGEPTLPIHFHAPATERQAKALAQWVKRSYEILHSHEVNKERSEAGKRPANICLPRGCGVRPELPPFAIQNGASGGLVVEVGLIRGLGRFVGMQVLEATGATGGLDTDHISLASTALSALDSNQIVLCNLKAPDVAGHDGQWDQKMQAIAKLDEMAGMLLDSLYLRNTLLIVTGDHSTPVSVRDHSGDSLPIAFVGHGVRPDSVQTFGERSCAQGNLGRLRGLAIMSILRNLLGIAPKFGA
ncbi:MAG: 2,3-bisphosphoglycerate-independent phosphoglycerate mutase [Candidatus Zipacnadales bacterium]